MERKYFLYEEVEIGRIRAVHIGGHSSDCNVVKQFLAGHAHHVHRHLAGDELYAVVYSCLAELFE